MAAGSKPIITKSDVLYADPLLVSPVSFRCGGTLLFYMWNREYVYKHPIVMFHTYR